MPGGNDLQITKSKQFLGWRGRVPASSVTWRALWVFMRTKYGGPVTVCGLGCGPTARRALGPAE
jgi:hypothetical protein